MVPRVNIESEGRYQNDHPFTYKELENLCNEYKDFFELDARHMLWITAIETNELLVYDNHNVIYYYGDFNKVIELLEEKGFIKEEVKFPWPHSHRYNAENDLMEEHILTKNMWIKYPLKKEDY